MYTKAALVKLGYEDVFAFEGEAFVEEFKDDDNRQRQIWRNFEQRNESVRNLRGIVDCIHSAIAMPKFKKTGKKGFILEKLNGPFVKDFSKFETKAQEDPLGLLAVGFAFLKGVPIPTHNLEVARLIAFLDRLIMPRALLLGESQVVAAFLDNEKRQTELINDFSEFRENAMNEIETLKNAYADKLKFNEPKQYFIDKEIWHKKIIFTLFAILLLILLSLIFVFNHNLLPILLDWKNIFGSKFYLIGLICISFILASGFILRLLAKLLSQQINLLSDAQHKSTFINVYLALESKEGLKANDAERALILKSLFKMPGDAAEDDVAASTIAEWLSKKNA